MARADHPAVVNFATRLLSNSGLEAGKVLPAVLALLPRIDMVVGGFFQGRGLLRPTFMGEMKVRGELRQSQGNNSTMSQANSVKSIGTILMSLGCI